MTEINLQEFMKGHKTVDIIFDDKKWIFREPTINEILSLDNKEDIEKFVRKMLIKGSYEELDKTIQETMSISQKKEFFANLLKKLGLI